MDIEVGGKTIYTYDSFSPLAGPIHVGGLREGCHLFPLRKLNLFASNDYITAGRGGVFSAE